MPPERPLLADLTAELARYPNTGRFLMGRARGEMTEQERARLEAMLDRTEWLEKPTRIIAAGERPRHSTMLIEGYMVRTLDGDDGRYSVSLHVPGDFVDLHCFALKRLDHNIDTIGRCKVGYVPHSALQQAMRDDPHLSRLLWFSTLLDAAIHREWITSLEHLTTPRRIAHVFAEVWHRLAMVGLGGDEGFEAPLTQLHLSEMCGASAVHINRALRDLRTLGIAQFDRGKVRIPDRQAVEEYADFKPGYLYGPWSLADDARKQPQANLRQ